MYIMFFDCKGTKKRVFRPMCVQLSVFVHNKLDICQ